MEPRRRPTWHGRLSGRSPSLIAHIGPLDIYYEPGIEWIRVVGPTHRKVDQKSKHNYDIYSIIDERLNLRERRDVHIELHEMCELYQLAVERGYIRETA